MLLWCISLGGSILSNLQRFLFLFFKRCTSAFQYVGMELKNRFLVLFLKKFFLKDCSSSLFTVTKVMLNINPS